LGCLSQGNSSDCVVWFALAIRTRQVVVVATSLIPIVVVVVVVVVVATRVVLAFAANGIVFGVRLVLFVGP
jgi:di/tricarboxylate transporter